MADDTARCRSFKITTWVLAALLVVLLIGLALGAVAAFVPRGRRHRRGSRHHSGPRRPPRRGSS
ncbi:hypothetical protein [Actinomadura rubrisoli]|uniref:Uncharacterized protein n=1 Tax=Actinomadura rubrisoli TaxID=2530368 RepID=A0A4R5C2Y1_9ACTN|nr:hypothetical protein [Actinomadura rubrisoli]TDD92220.1 hypothetical protein E1298_10895 [Actinomadura rubrisoli]